MTPLKILVLGCGYVGAHFAEKAEDLYEVTVTARSESSIAKLKTQFESVLPVDVSSQFNLLQAVIDQDIIVITIAAHSIEDYVSTYVGTMEHLNKIIPLLETPPRAIIYTSSTSVYAEKDGRLTTETSPLESQLSPQKFLVEAETLLNELRSESTRVCIFRLSEIYGPSRELSKRVKGLIDRTSPGDGSQPTNMIHVDDVAEAILFAIHHRLDDTFNLSDDEHMSRKELYDEISKAFDLPAVTFNPQQVSHHGGKKIVDNKKIKAKGFNFLHPQRELL